MLAGDLEPTNHGIASRSTNTFAYLGKQTLYLARAKEDLKKGKWDLLLAMPVIDDGGTHT